MSQMLAEKFLLTRVVGRGPHGVVWKARHVVTRDNCAVKLLDPTLAADSSVKDRFVREGIVLQAYLSPVYVRIRELIIAADTLALVSEYVDGVSLLERLAQAGPLPLEEASSITATAAEALAAGHEAGVVHCGVKPANVLLSRLDGRVRITDCRLAHLVRGSSPEETRSSPAISAPELHLRGYPTRATDVYGVGLLLYQALTATLPPDREVTPVHVPETLDYRVREILAGCLAWDPDARPTAAEVAAVLRGIAPTPQSADPLIDVSRLPGTGSHLPTPVTDREEPSPSNHGEPTQTQLTPGSRRPYRSRWRVASAGALVAAAAAGAIVGISRLAGSGHTDGSDTTAGVVHTDVLSRTSAPAAPVAATEAAAHSASGAQAFVQFWFDALNYAVATGNTAPMQEASSPDCEACTAAIRSFTTGHEDGLSMLGGEYTLRSVHIDSFFDLDRPVLRVVYDRSARSTVDAGGRTQQTLPGVNFVSCQVILERHDGKWRVIDEQSPVAVA
jgi:serine/threonine protein kinase